MPQADAQAPLRGIGVLVTRPREQNAALCARLAALGAQPLAFPTLALLPPDDVETTRRMLRDGAPYDMAIFVSPAAVRWGLAALPADMAVPALANVLATVGAGSAAALRAAGVDTVLQPDGGEDSEHLLALPELTDLTGKRVLILRGERGRELIADTLRARGAEVSHAACYRRGCPDHANSAPVVEALAEGRLAAGTVFSSETLDNLLRLLPAAAVRQLRALPLFAPHARIAAHARTLGFDQAIATAPGETGVVQGLIDHFADVHA